MKTFHEMRAQIDELSRKTLANYTKKAVRDVDDTSFDQGGEEPQTPRWRKKQTRLNKRNKGIKRALNRLSK